MLDVVDKTLDFFSLFRSLQPEDCAFEETKEFLKNKFHISFNSISEDINSSKDIDFDEIFSILYRHAYGYSLSHFNDCIYGEYTHTHRLMSADIKTLENLDEQLKLHCVISSLYTISAITERSHERLFDLPNYYSKKIYSRNQKKTLMIPKITSGDKELVGKISRAFSSLVKQTSSQDIPLLSEHILENYLNYYYEKETQPEIAKFLREFSFDLVVNQMQGGLNFVTKFKTISKYSKGEDNYRREIKRFLEKLKLLDKNFVCTDESNTTSLLYNWKKEHCFHINMIKYLVEKNDCLEIFNATETLLSFPVMLSLCPLNSILHQLICKKETFYTDFVLKYLSSITFPVFKYAFLITICEHWNYALEDIKIKLSEYLNSCSFEAPNYTHELDSNTIVGNKTDTLGSALLETYHAEQYTFLKPFDDSFQINVHFLSSEENLNYFQGATGLAYYENILC